MRDFDYIAELVERVKQNDLLAMKILYNEFAREMLSASYRITQNTSDAEDILQESFMASFDKIHKLNESRNYGAWLKIAFGRCAGNRGDRCCSWRYYLTLQQLLKEHCSVNGHTPSCSLTAAKFAISIAAGAPSE